MPYKPKELYFFIGTDADKENVEVMFTTKEHFKREGSMADHLGKHNMPVDLLFQCGINPHEETESTFSIFNGYTPRQVYNSLIDFGFKNKKKFNLFMNEDALPDEWWDVSITNNLDKEEHSYNNNQTQAVPDAEIETDEGFPVSSGNPVIPATGVPLGVPDNKSTRSLFDAIRGSGAQVWGVGPGGSGSMTVGSDGSTNMGAGMQRLDGGPQRLTNTMEGVTTGDQHPQGVIDKLGLDGQTHYVMGDKVVIPLTKLEKLNGKVLVSEKYGNGKIVNLETKKKGTPDEFDIIEVEFDVYGRSVSMKYSLADGMALEEPIKGMYDLTIPDDLIEDPKVIL